MSQSAAAPAFGPYRFTLTDDEARVAAERSGLRAALAHGLLTRHFAPLAAFTLIIAFAAILGLTGLVSRRAAEATLLLAAAAFMIQRMTTRFRIRRARLEGRASIEALRAAGELTLAADDSGVTLAGPIPQLRLAFRDCVDAEDAGGLVYLWPRRGAPACVPARVFGAQDEGQRLAAFLRAGIAKAKT